MNGGNSRDFQRFGDELKDDASRWLDREILGRANREHVVKSLIETIDREARLEAWLAVELALERGDDGPRKAIIGQLNQRRQELDVYGERPDRLVARDEPRDLPPVETSWPDRDDVSEASDRAVFSGSGRWSSLEADDEPSADADGAEADVAADGGEQQ